MSHRLTAPLIHRAYPAIAPRPYAALAGRRRHPGSPPKTLGAYLDDWPDCPN